MNDPATQLRAIAREEINRGLATTDGRLFSEREVDWWVEHVAQAIAEDILRNFEVIARENRRWEMEA